MEKQDLRIGNLIRVIKKGRFKNYLCVEFLVEEIYRDELENDEYLIIVDVAHSFSLTDIEVIPLTEESMSIFAFEKNKYDIVFKTKSDNMFIIENWHGEWFYTVGEGVKLSKPLKYIHELQNACHALTGEELVLNR